MTLNEWEQINIEVLTSREMGEWLSRRENRLLDKIRAEIQQTADEEQKHDEKWAIGLRYAMKIIDKYKVESEVRNEKG